jgi:hypothetical protein
MLDLQTVEATSSRQVGYTVALLPWPRRWGKVLAHLASKHPETTPTGDRNAVVNPGQLVEWHREMHLSDDVWLVRGSPTLHPHRHAGTLARWRERYEWRP